MTQFKRIGSAREANDSALLYLQQAADLLNKNADVGHGYDSKELRRKITNNIKTLSDIISKRKSKSDE